jgi:hypothetical protein
MEEFMTILAGIQTASQASNKLLAVLNDLLSKKCKNSEKELLISLAQVVLSQQDLLRFQQEALLVIGEFLTQQFNIREGLNETFTRNQTEDN